MTHEQDILQSRILIVDDEPLNVELLEQILAQEGFQSVLGLTAPTRVLEMIPRYQPDVILLDLRMPDMDGYTILSRLQTLKVEGEYLPVIVLTADVSREARHRALALGAHDFLTKPFDVVEVVLRVWNLLETRQLHQRLRSLAGPQPVPRRPNWG